VRDPTIRKDSMWVTSYDIMSHNDYNKIHYQIVLTIKYRIIVTMKKYVGCERPNMRKGSLWVTPHNIMMIMIKYTVENVLVQLKGYTWGYFLEYWIVSYVCCCCLESINMFMISFVEYFSPFCGFLPMSFVV